MEENYPATRRCFFLQSTEVEEQARKCVRNPSSKIELKWTKVRKCLFYTEKQYADYKDSKQLLIFILQYYFNLKVYLHAVRSFETQSKYTAKEWKKEKFIRLFANVSFISFPNCSLCSDSEGMVIKRHHSAA